MSEAFLLDPQFAETDADADADADASALAAHEDHSNLFVLGTDRHDLAVPMARMVENVLDWEHLPWVHPENFVSSEHIEHGRRWYRARFGNSGTPKTYNQVLVVLHASDRSHSRWSIILEEGPRAGHVVYTTAERLDEERIVTHVTFYSPTRPRNEVTRRAMFAVFKKQYDQIYDQDLEMMRDRQEALNRLTTRASDVSLDAPLGTVEAVGARLPILLTHQGRRFWIRTGPAGLEAVAADCAHRLGLLPCTAHGEVSVCPLHGYAFDLVRGRSADGRGLKLATPPQVDIRDGQVWLS